LIEDPLTWRRLARIFTQAELAKVLNERMLWASVEEKPAPAWGPMTRVQSAEAFLDAARDLLDLAAPLLEGQGRNRHQVRNVRDTGALALVTTMDVAGVCAGVIGGPVARCAA
jgi:alkylation response protein AidB-like acyl-CoA dehydrogenase